VVLALDTCVLNHAAGIGLQTRHGTSDVAVDFDNLLYRARLEERRGDALLYAEDYAFACCYLDIVSLLRLVLGWRRTPIAVEPSLMASSEYSTWKRRPSGEKVLWICERAVLFCEARGGRT
jgi:hypothetical protein